MKTRFVNCPQCGKIVTWDAASRYRPFCSERCRVIDLGAWATDRYSIPAQGVDDDAEPAAEPGAQQ